VLLTVLGVFFAWSGVQVKWIRDRHAILARPGIVSKTGRFSVEPPPATPWTLRPFGEQAYREILVVVVDDDRALDYVMGTPADDEKVRPEERSKVLRIGQLFPEAFVGVWSRRNDPAPLPVIPKVLKRQGSFVNPLDVSRPRQPSGL